ncbi:hypothetical protein [Paenibacillus sp.]|uniref:GAF domain-containing protein n=1 Tax=Paenibacillus sp. TaxID=58172 RepID=UPI002D4F7CA7|nr:hypothetical protein [Paenibacillus sp.]HZG86399.1 hypothetical protein [Paenibacillus sp.]
MGHTNNAILHFLRSYKLNKEVVEKLSELSPVEAKKTDNVTLLMEALKLNKEISDGHLKTLEVKRELGKFCRDLEAEMEDAHVAIMFWSKEENTFYHGAGPSVPIEFYSIFSLYKGKFDETFSSCGVACNTGKLAVTSFETSDCWEGVREFAVVTLLGYRSVWSYPFRDSVTGSIVGTFAVMSPQSQRVPTQAEIDLLDTRVKHYSDEIRFISEQLKKRNPAIVDF